MSETLRKMLQSRLGYRTESYSGSGVRGLHGVLTHELSVLRNTDILVYCNQHYSTHFFIPGGHGFPKPLKVNTSLQVQRIEELVRRRLGKSRRLYGLWLTTKEDVHRYYGGVDEQIDCYVIPEDTFVLSDLGPEGTLFVFQKHPRSYMKANLHNKKHAGLLKSLWKHWLAVSQK